MEEIMADAAGAPAAVHDHFLRSYAYNAVHRNETFTTMATSVVWQWAAVPFSLLLGMSGWILNGSWTPAQAAHRTELKLVGT